VNTLDVLLEELKPNLGDEPPYLRVRRRRRFFPRMFTRLGYTCGAEIGVESGEFAEILCRAGLKLYAIDPWLCYGYYETTHAHQGRMDERYERTLKRLAPFDCEVMREFSHEAAEKFEDGSLDFVHIDGNHDEENAYRDIEVWTPKVRVGGIISGHDYFNSRNHARCRVKDAVDRWVGEQGIGPWFLIMARNGRPPTPSWFWVKE
jgi:hypothetical protein